VEDRSESDQPEVSRTYDVAQARVGARLVEWLMRLRVREALREHS
jgi:hypothetical protein